jgi:branched-chain amino acid aminotransferase
MRLHVGVLAVAACLTGCHGFGVVSPFVSTSRKSTMLQVATEEELGLPGTADMDWSDLGFEFRPTKSHLQMMWKDGEWGPAELIEVRYI